MVNKKDIGKTEKVPTRKKILTAAEEVFAENGFHKTLVEDIAIRAGLGKGTIYRYFTTKTDLFQSLIFESFDELKEIVSSETERHDNTTDKLKAGIKAYLEFFKRHKKLFAIIVFEHSEIGCGEHSECFEKFGNLIGLLKNFAEMGISDGTFKGIDPETLSYGVLGTVNYVLFKWIMSRTEYDIMDELDTIYEMTLKGVLR